MTGPQEQPKLARLAPIIMGSKRDLDFVKGKIVSSFGNLGIGYELRIASAHKHPEYLLEILGEYDAMEDTAIVYVAVAGRQAALPATIAAHTPYPVIFCPKDPTDANMLSALDTPKGVDFTTVLYPENVAGAVLRLTCNGLPERLAQMREYLGAFRKDIEQADEEVRTRRS